MFIHFFQNKMFEYSIKNNEMLKYNLPLLFYYFLPKVFSVFFILIIKSTIKEEESLVKKDKKVIRRYHVFIRSKNKKKIYFLIFIISLLEVVYKIDDSLLAYLYKNGTINLLVEKRIGFIIFVPFFSYYILNKQIYRHHLLALILALLGSFILSFCRFKLELSKIEDLPYHILNILFSSFFSLALVLTKFIMVKYLIEAYNLLFYDGIFCIINTLICVLLEYFIIMAANPDEKFHDYFVNNYYEIINIFFWQNWEFYLSFFLTIIASFCYFVFNILTIFHFSPSLNVLTDFLTPFFLNIVNFVLIEYKNEEEKDKDIKRFIYENIGYIIIIFGALILNEIIIINLFGLSENTYSKICDRGLLDSKCVEEISPNISLATENDNLIDNEPEVF
jgi:hypothetical protein